MCGVVAAQPLLPQLRVQLDLVDRGTDMCVVEQPPQVVWLEAGHPDHAPALIGVELLEGAPCLDVSVAAGPGPMDEVPVDLVLQRQLVEWISSSAVVTEAGLVLASSSPA